jgi:small subunit ribosomal protein S16
MALSIRMARQGRKKVAHYTIVVADSRAPRDGRYIEKLGTYTPYLPADSDKRVVLNTDRVKHWLSVGAQPSERLSIILSKLGLVEKPVFATRPKKSAPKAKAQERAKERADKAAKAAEAAAAAAAPKDAPAADASAADAPAA